MSKDKLKELIQKNHGYITTQDAKQEGIHREYLTMFVEEEKLIRVSPGVYQTPEVWEDRLYNLQQKKTRMIYSHDTALYLHGLSDRDPIKYHVTLPTGYNTSQIKEVDLVTYTIKPALFELGRITIKSPYGNDILVYDKERTVCDIIRSRNRIDKQILNNGIKRYVNDSSRNLINLLAYAKTMGIENVLRNYMGILL
ncbi:MAG: type IV toxin-antitoxin system AbiEi family antitoxin domain-containing protein [Acholeplasmataceae bacterium]|nr:type IV toxin-antitoxin system AbiEi family antitoxin domain-containing protein [Acholeplasmataceae bacterium]